MKQAITQKTSWTFVIFEPEQKAQLYITSLSVRKFHAVSISGNQLPPAISPLGSCPVFGPSDAQHH